MKSLNNNTLEDLSKYSDKTFKLFQFLNLSGQPFMIDQIAKTGQTNNEVEIIEAFRKDIQETAKLIKKSHLLLSVVDEHDRVLHLKGGKSNNLNELFGESYNSNEKTIKFGDIEIPLKKEIDSEIIENKLYQNILGISKSDYESLFKSRKRVYKYSEDSLSDEEERVAFLSVVSTQEHYKPIIDKIKSYQQEFNEYRSNLSEEYKNKIDNEITFNRSMVDSVTKQSTFITKENIVQIASGHKKQKELLSEIQHLLGKSKYVKSVELDKDTSLENFISVLKQVDETRLNLKNEIILKVRKLGNYNANGLYFPAQKIVAVDLSKPSSLIHELTHAVDYSDYNIHNSLVRNQTIEHFKRKIRKEELPEGKENYFLSNVEIIARLGEVTFLLEKFNYQKNEGVENFIKRAQHEELQKSADDLSMIKPAKEYLNNIYFNLQDWNENDIKMARNFYSMFYNVNNDEIKPIDDVIIEHEKARIIGKRTITRYQETSTSYFTPDTIKDSLNYNKEHNILDTEYLLRRIIGRPCELGKTTKAFNAEHVEKQKAMLKNVGEWIKEQDNPYYAYVALSEIYKVNTFSSNVIQLAKVYNVIIKGAENNFDTFEVIKRNEKEIKEKREQYEKLRHEQINNYSLNKFNELNEARSQFNDARKLPLTEQNKFLSQYSSDSLSKGYSEHSDAYLTKVDNKTKSRYLLNNVYIREYNVELLSPIISVIEKYGFDSILSFADKEENLVTTFGIENSNGNNILKRAINEYIRSENKHGDFSKQDIYKNNLSALQYIGYFDKINVENPCFEMLYKEQKDTLNSVIKKTPINFTKAIYTILSKPLPIDIKEMDLEKILSTTEDLSHKYKKLYSDFVVKPKEEIENKIKNQKTIEKQENHDENKVNINELNDNKNKRNPSEQIKLF